jgi:hypothetical protein
MLPSNITTAAAATFSDREMLRSLITCARVRRDRFVDPAFDALYEPYVDPSDTDFVFVSTHMLSLHEPSNWAPLQMLVHAPERAASRPAVRRQVFASDLVHEICAHPALQHHSPHTAFKAGLTAGQFILPCAVGAHCSYKGAAHGDDSEPVWLLLDAFNRRWLQRCHAAGCHAAQQHKTSSVPRWQQWQSMPDDLGALCTRYLKEEFSGCRPMRGLRECLFGDGPQSL